VIKSSPARKSTLTGRDGVELTVHGNLLWRLCDGEITHLVSYREFEDVLEAAGLKEQAMSQENVELIRRAIEAWNRGDIDGWLDQATPDFVWIPAGPAAVEHSIYRGRDEVREAMAGGWETWEEFRFEESEIRSLGESVVWLGRVHARGRASEVELDQEFAIHAVVRDGRLARTEGFLSRAEALEAAGLQE
jgi:ketosteroid isomerase-like protein